MINEENYRHFFTYNYTPLEGKYYAALPFICLLFSIPAYFLCSNRKAAMLLFGIALFIFLIVECSAAIKKDKKRMSFLVLGSFYSYMCICMFFLAYLLFITDYPKNFIIPLAVTALSALCTVFCYLNIRHKIKKDKFNKKGNKLSTVTSLIFAVITLGLARIIWDAVPTDKLDFSGAIFLLWAQSFFLMELLTTL